MLPDIALKFRHQDEARNPLGVLRGESIANHVADIMRDEVGSVDFQMIEHARYVAGLGLFVKAPRRAWRRGPFLAGQAPPRCDRVQD